MKTNVIYDEVGIFNPDFELMERILEKTKKHRDKYPDRVILECSTANRGKK